MHFHTTAESIVLVTLPLMRWFRVPMDGHDAGHVQALAQHHEVRLQSRGLGELVREGPAAPAWSGP
jgi:hypothetical protein